MQAIYGSCVQEWLPSPDPLSAGLLRVMRLLHVVMATLIICALEDRFLKTYFDPVLIPQCVENLQILINETAEVFV
jgi:hypothetical protein